MIEQCLSHENKAASLELTIRSIESIFRDALKFSGNLPIKFPIKIAFARQVICRMLPEGKANGATPPVAAI